MSLTEKFEKRAYPAFLAGLVLMAAAIQTKIFLGGTIETRFLLVIVITMMTGFFFVDYFSNNPRLYIAAGVMLVVGAFVVWSNFSIIRDALVTNNNIKILCIILIVGILLYISQQFFVLRILVCAGYWCAMFFLIYKNLFPVKTVMFALIGELVMVTVEVKDRIHFRKQEKRNKKMFFLFPIVLIVMFVLSLLPYKAEPIEWKVSKKVIKIAREVIEEIVETVSNWGTDTYEFGISFIGYSESGDITGDKVDFDGDALDLTMVGNQEHIYLAGSLKSEYVGNSWTGNPKNNGYDGAYETYELDTAEFLYAMYRAGIIGKNSIWYLHYKNLEVEYDGINTASFFRPSNTIDITLEKHKGKFISDKDNVSFSKNQSSKTKYSLRYFSVNRAADQMIDAVREQSKYRYENSSMTDFDAFKRVVYSKYTTVMLPQTEDFEKELKQRAEYIRETYLNIPEIISERTYQLARDITKGCNTDYDKVAAILEYLSDYTYTITPGSIPEGKDVVEYFLFESKQGYCTYFATAAAILSRCVGIPTRYVQGYLLDIGCLGDYGSYNVKEEQAHAWIECYFEGVGWLTFEPTPGNIKYLYQRWDTPAFVTYSEVFGDEIPDSGTVEERPEQKPGNITETEPEEPEELPEEPEEPEEILPLPDYSDIFQEEKKDSILPGVLKYAGITVGLFMISCFIYFKIKEYRFWSIYHKASIREKIHMDMRMLFWIITEAGHPMEDSETLNNYVERIKEYYPDKAVVLANVNKVYVKLRYNERYNATAEESRMTQRLRLSFMDKSVKENAMARQCLKQIVADYR